MTDDIAAVSQNEIDAIDKEVKSQLAAEVEKNNQELAKKIRADVEKEMSQKQEFESIKARAKANEDALKKSQEDAKVAMEKQKQELSEQFKKQLEEALASKRGISGSNESPFSQPSNNPNLKTLPNGKQIDVSDPKVLDSIEEGSRTAFMQFAGIDPMKNPEWGTPFKKQ